MAAWKIAPAIAAGNSIVLKPSEMTPFSIVRLAELAIEAGLPAGIFNIVQGDGRSVGDPLVRRPEVAKVTFTGSTATGAAIMTACAQTGPKPVTLELGGKSPQIIFADAGLDKASAIVARAITLNAGQVCVAGSRLLVQDKVADQVIDRIMAAFAAHKPGPTWASYSTLGPIISDGQLDRIDGIVQRAVTDGAQVLAGGTRATAPQDGSYFLPTLLQNAAQHSEAVQSEIFGPVLAIIKARDFDHALEIANNTEFGLTGGVWTKNKKKQERAKNEFHAGNFYVNRKITGALVGVHPFGGFNMSGTDSKAGGRDYLLLFMQAKLISQKIK